MFSRIISSVSRVAIRRVATTTTTPKRFVSNNTKKLARSATVAIETEVSLAFHSMNLKFWFLLSCIMLAVFLAIVYYFLID